MSDFVYKAMEGNKSPYRVYTNTGASFMIASDVIHMCLSNRNTVLGYEPKYFSHVVELEISDRFIVFAIDFDIINMNAEIIAVDSKDENFRYHYKKNAYGIKQYDNTNSFKGESSQITYKYIRLAVIEIYSQLYALYHDRSKKYCKVLSECYESDLEEVRI